MRDLRACPRGWRQDHDRAGGRSGAAFTVILPIPMATTGKLLTARCLILMRMAICAGRRGSLLNNHVLTSLRFRGDLRLRSQALLGILALRPLTSVRGELCRTMNLIHLATMWFDRLTMNGRNIMTTSKVAAAKLAKGNSAVTSNQSRCFWATGVPDFYEKYHDEEWGALL